MLVPQQRFRRHQDERLAERAMHLPAQHVEIIGRRRGIGDLDIVLRAKLQITLETRGGMLRALAFIAMRQQHHEAAHAQPFHFAGRDELVDHDLRAIGEIAELRFPENERARLRGAVAVFETEHGFFGKQRIDHFEFALTVADMGERHDSALRFPDRPARDMALRERAARRILSGKTHRAAFIEQRAEGERFARRPVEAVARSRTSAPSA